VVSPVCASVNGPVTVPVYCTAPSETLTIVNAEQVPLMVAILSLLGRKPIEFKRMLVLAEKRGMTGNANNIIIKIFKINLSLIASPSPAFR
jgi:hypothetical protein